MTGTSSSAVASPGLRRPPVRTTFSVSRRPTAPASTGVPALGRGIALDSGAGELRRSVR
ncbi:hypothetical protein OG607_25095 [Streptomyces sp. NBC_01537]|uniref:hypothetical protein n=1 Tax=Streptomyces sp. NBC_01537 TaxID=2903896 RepID=UPI003863BD8E